MVKKPLLLGALRQPMGITRASYKYLRKSPCETNSPSVRTLFEGKRVFWVLQENFAEKEKIQV